MNMYVRLKKRQSQARSNISNIRSIQEPEVRTAVTNNVNNRFHKLHEENVGNLDEEAKWIKIKEAIITTQESIGKGKNKTRQRWMTEEILAPMEERRFKGRDNTKYKEIQNTIRNEIRIAKEVWMTKKCKEIEELEQKYGSFGLHKKLKEVW